MLFATIAQFVGSLRRSRSRQSGSQSPLQRYRSSSCVNDATQETTSCDFNMSSNRSVSSSFYFSSSDTRSIRLESDPIEISTNSMQSICSVDPASVVKTDQKKLRKALKDAEKQERKEARKMRKRTKAAVKSWKKHNNPVALLYAESISDCSTLSNETILSEIWAMSQLNVDRKTINELPQVEEDAQARPSKIEFLFFSGCPDDRNRFESEFGYRRRRSCPRAMRYPLAPSITTTIPIKPTLVSNMPRVFTPRFDIVPRK